MVECRTARSNDARPGSSVGGRQKDAGQHELQEWRNEPVKLRKLSHGRRRPDGRRWATLTANRRRPMTLRLASPTVLRLLLCLLVIPSIALSVPGQQLESTAARLTERMKNDLGLSADQVPKVEAVNRR